MTFVGIFSAPGTPIGPEVVNRGITYSCTYSGIGTWGVNAAGEVYQLCISFRAEDQSPDGLAHSRYWIRHHSEVRPQP